MSCSYRKYNVTFQKVLLSIFGYSLNPPPPPIMPRTFTTTGPPFAFFVIVSFFGKHFLSQNNSFFSVVKIFVFSKAGVFSTRRFSYLFSSKPPPSHNFLETKRFVSIEDSLVFSVQCDLSRNKIHFLKWVFCCF